MLSWSRCMERTGAAGPWPAALVLAALLLSAECGAAAAPSRVHAADARTPSGAVQHAPEAIPGFGHGLWRAATWRRGATEEVREHAAVS